MSSLESKVELLQQDHEKLRSDMQRYLEEKHIDNFPTIRNSIAFLPASMKVEQIPLFGLNQQMEILSSLTFSSIFSLFKEICTFPNISLLEHLIRLFGNEDIHTKLTTYMKKLQVFRAQTKVKEFTAPISTLPVEFLNLTIEMKCEWHRSTLEDVELLRRSVTQKASLMSYGIQLLQVEWEQGLLHLCVPSRALECIITSLDSTFLQENHIEILSVEGKHMQSAQTVGSTAFIKFPMTTSLPCTSTKDSASNILPTSSSSAAQGQTMVQDQSYSQMVQFKPVASANIEQRVSSSTHTMMYTSQTVAVPIICPQVVPPSNGLPGSNMGHLAAVPFLQHPGSPQLPSYVIVNSPEQPYLPSLSPSFGGTLHQPDTTILYTPQRAKPIKCQICSKPLQSARAYTRHLRLHMKLQRQRKSVTEAEGKVEIASEDSNDVVEIGEEEERGKSEELEDVEREEMVQEETTSPNHASDSPSNSERAVETTKHSQKSSVNSLTPTMTSSSSYEPCTETGHYSACVPGTTVTSGPLPSFNELLQFVEKEEECRKAKNGPSLNDSSQKRSRRFRCKVCGRYLSSQLALNGHLQSMHKPHCHIYNEVIL